MGHGAAKATRQPAAVSQKVGWGPVLLARSGTIPPGLGHRELLWLCMEQPGVGTMTLFPLEALVSSTPKQRHEIGTKGNYQPSSCPSWNSWLP